MHLATNIVVALAIGAVAVALMLGLANMLRGGSANASQMFMRWRVGLQFVAILIILAILYFRG
jgi:membrane protein implicated in regulation of membrane protease activity